MSVADWLRRRAGPDAAQIRAEIWSLGNRHHGFPLEGALKELGAAQALAPERSRLLHACVRSLRAR